MYEGPDENYYYMANQELEFGSFEKAILLYDKAIQLSPQSYYYYKRGVAYYSLTSSQNENLSNIENAIKDFSTAISGDVSVAEYYYYRALANIKKLKIYNSDDNVKIKPELFIWILSDYKAAIILNPSFEEKYQINLDDLHSNCNIDDKTYNDLLNKFKLDINENNNDKKNNIFYLAINKYSGKKAALYLFIMNLVSRYLSKVQQILTEKKYDNTDIDNIMRNLDLCASHYIGNVPYFKIELELSQIKILINIGMELALNTILALYNNSILSNDDDTFELINFIRTSLYNLEIEYIKRNDNLKNMHNDIKKSFYNEFSKYLKMWFLDNDKIDIKQFKKILNSL